jgi:hypothetical protein
MVVVEQCGRDHQPWDRDPRQAVGLQEGGCGGQPDQHAQETTDHPQ